jgi:hypothetical protein
MSFLNVALLFKKQLTLNSRFGIDSIPKMPVSIKTKKVMTDEQSRSAGTP